jgi:hypothetical protein
MSGDKSEPQSFFGSDVANLEIFGGNGGGGGGSIVPPQPNPNSKPIVNLGAKDLTLTDSKGAQTTLSKIFGDADYVMVDLSRNGCGGCKYFSDLIEEKKQLFATKCKAITLADDLSAWVAFAGGNSGSHSYSPQNGINTASGKLGFALPYTPAIAVIDRLGNLKAQPDPNSTNVVMPSFIEQNCL